MKFYLPVRKERDGLRLSNRLYTSRQDAEQAIRKDIRTRHLSRSHYAIHEIYWQRLEAYC